MSALVFSPSRRPVPARRGFTLIEMMITLAIFLLLAAMVFALLTGTLQGAAMLQDNQDRSDRLVALGAFLKHKLMQMPARSTIASYQRGDGEGLIQNGIVFGNTNFATAIDAKVQPNGLYLLRLTTFATTADAQEPQDARQVLNQAVTSDDPTLIWTPLLQDVKTLTWRFQDVSLVQWENVWVNSNTPNLVELSLQAAGEPVATTFDWWVPLISPVQVRIQGNGGSGGGRSNGGGNNGGRNGGRPPGEGPPPRGNNL